MPRSTPLTAPEPITPTTPTNVLPHPTLTQLQDEDPYNPNDSSSTFTPSFTSLDLAPEFDVIHELTTQRDLYYGDKENALTLSGIPIYIKSCVERLAIRVPSRGRPPSLSLTTACCITHGIREITDNRYLRDFSRIHHRLLRNQAIQANYFDLINRWFNNFHLSFPDTRGSGRVNWSTLLPDDVRGDVTDLKARYGSSFSMWGSIALVITLAQQCDPTSPNTGPLLPEHVRDLANVVDIFETNCRLHYEMSQGVLGVFGGTNHQRDGGRVMVPVRPARTPRRT